MRVTSIVFVILGSIALGVLISAQQIALSQGGPLSGALRNHVKDGRFAIVTSIRGLRSAFATSCRPYSAARH
jgi:hypothetical protein